MGYQLIETVTLASAASSIEFTSIPQDGVDLLVKLSLRNTTGTDIRGINLYFNADTATNYSHRTLRGDGSSVASASGTADSLEVGWMPGATTTANTFGNAQVYISNYTSSTAKTTSSDAVTENNGTTAYASIFASSWSGTDAITSISIDSAGDIAEHSTASLYKITAD
jgi:hypothetical protein